MLFKSLIDCSYYLDVYKAIFNHLWDVQKFIEDEEALGIFRGTLEKINFTLYDPPLKQFLPSGGILSTKKMFRSDSCRDFYPPPPTVLSLEGAHLPKKI